MSQVTMSTTTTTPPVTVVYCGASLITSKVMPAPTSVGQMTLAQQGVVLLSKLIPRDTMRHSLALPM